MRFLRRSLVGIFLISLTLGLFAWGGNIFYGALQTRWSEEQKSHPSRERAFAANVLKVETRSITPVLISFGEVLSRRTLELRATAAGPIVELGRAFEEGGKVSQGQLLVRIDPSDAQAALDLTRNDLQEAEAEARDAARGVDLAADELVSAKAQLGLREQALARQEKLLNRGVGTETAVEVAQLTVSSAKQAVLAQRKSMANAEARADQAKTSLARWSINLTEAERALAETEIYAGFSGTLADVTAVEGGIVTTNEKLAQIIDANSLEVAFRVSTPQYVRLLDQDGALILAGLEISLDIFGVDLTTHGTITRESAAVGEGQTGRLLFARIETSKGFRPGDFVTVEIEEPVLHNVALLPASAVDSASSVLVLDPDDRLEVIQVEVLRRQANEVIVSADGIAGRDLVAERSPLLGAGILVRPIRPAAEDGAVSAGTNASTGPELVELSPERRAKMVAFVEGNSRMPAAAKERVLGQLRQDKVPAQVVERIESRMGG